MVRISGAKEPEDIASRIVAAPAIKEYSLNHKI